MSRRIEGGGEREKKVGKKVRRKWGESEEKVCRTRGEGEREKKVGEREEKVGKSEAKLGESKKKVGRKSG